MCSRLAAMDVDLSDTVETMWAREVDVRPECVCEGKTARAISTLDAVHGAMEVDKYFAYVRDLLSGSLPNVGRPRNLLVRGNRGAGKSMLIDLVVSIVPEMRQFPLLCGPFGFQGYSPDTHVLIVNHDIRLPPLPVSETLLCFEGRQFSFNVKGDPTAHVARKGVPLVAGSNVIAPGQEWRQPDVDAFLSRCVVVSLVKDIPESLRIQGLDTVCPKCRNDLFLSPRCLGTAAPEEPNPASAWSASPGSPSPGHSFGLDGETQ